MRGNKLLCSVVESQNESRDTGRNLPEAESDKHKNGNQHNYREDQHGIIFRHGQTTKHNVTNVLDMLKIAEFHRTTRLIFLEIYPVRMLLR